MHNSPGTPTGTGWPARSTTYSCVFAIGRPIDGGPLSGLHAATLAHTVASVGPYALKNRRPPAHAVTSAAGHASPATMIVSSAGTSPPRSVASTDGGSVPCVM